MDKKIQAKLLEYIVTIPQLLFATVLSFLSGHLWIWVIYAYYFNSTKASKYLNHWAAKTALGVFWYSITLVPYYFYKFGMKQEIGKNVLEVVGFTLLVGSFLQAITTMIIIKFKKA